MKNHFHVFNNLKTVKTGKKTLNLITIVNSRGILQYHSGVSQRRWSFLGFKVTFLKTTYFFNLLEVSTMYLKFEMLKQVVSGFILSSFADAFIMKNVVSYFIHKKFFNDKSFQYAVDIYCDQYYLRQSYLKTFEYMPKKQLNSTNK